MTRGWIGVLAIVTLLLILASIVTVQYGLGFRGKTLFAWMDILFVPIAVGIGLYLLEQSQRSREQNEQRRREEEREQAAALEEYLHQMGEALTEYELRQAEPDNEIAMLARARTLSVLGILDPVRKGQVISFLSGAGLININRPIIVLAGADLDWAFLRNQPIREIDLADTHLREANLTAADLYGANLRRTDLRGAYLSRAYLSEANLIGADLRGADLSEAYLSGAYLGSANLSQANLSEAYLSGADLGWADLGGANLSRANLSRANLSQANLSEADLLQADLSGADLNRAKGISDEKLERKARFLEGATMPNGQKYEEWRKSKGSNGEDGENSGPS